MNLISSLKKLPVYTTTGSFLLLLSIMLLSSPVDQIAITLIFFATLFVFIISLASLFLSYRGKRAEKKIFYKIAILSIFVVVALMFRSSQSLSLVNGFILFLTICGVVFYTDRRFK